ncbi:MAG: DUF3817 domain-containing protein [Thermoleophilia bacterium]
MLGTQAGRFRVVAVIEAISWLGLLIGMFFKYVVVEDDVGVSVFGPIHGVVFLLYVVAAFATWQSQRWSARVGLTAVLAGVPPFGSLVFERWAVRTGHLAPYGPRRTEPARA